ncbi:MAG: response regulator [Pseudomonadota bacterium]
MSSSIPGGWPGPEEGGLAPSLVAHDIRNVLTGLQGHLILARSRDGADVVSHDLDGIAAGVLLLTDLAASLDGATESAAQLNSVESMLNGLVATWRGIAEGIGTRIALDIDEAVIGLGLRSPLRVGRLLGNLISNAVRHGKSGAGQLGDVTVTARQRPDAALELSVVDTGPGLPPELIEAMRENEPPPAYYGGSGLVIAHRLARELDLELTLCNRRESGLSAQLVLPAQALVFAPGQPSAEQTGPSAGETAGGQDAVPDRLDGMHILLAEDNVTNQMVARQMLEMLGASVSVVSDGVEALQAVDEGGPFDLLLVDIEMPRLSGLDVIRSVRALPDARSGLPIIALTAYAMPEHRTRIKDAGSDGLIAKPILGVREFGAEILALIRHSQRHAPLREDAAVAQHVAGDGPIDWSIYSMLAQSIGPDSMCELLEKVETDLRDVANGIATGMAQDDVKLVRAKSHVLISVAGVIGAIDLQRAAEALNAAAHNADRAIMHDLAQRIDGSIIDLIEFVRREREALVSG